MALMLSDGWPSVGDRSSSGLVQIVEAWDGISLSTLGFAKHHHPDLMELLSATSGGRYHFVSDPLVCEYEFASALGTQQAMVASEVEVFVEPGDDVEFVETLGLEPTDVDEGTARIDLIDFTGKMQQITVPRLKVSPKEETDQFELAKITVRYYDEALQKGVTLQDKVYLNVADGPGPRNADVVADVLIAGAKQVRRRARRLADAGEQGGAGAEIAAMIDRIESAPTYRGKAGSPLNELCEDLREEREIISDGDEEKRRDYTFNNSNDRTRYTANRGVARYSLRPSTSAPEVVTLHIEEGTRAGEAVTVYDTNIIGRSSTVDIVFDDDAISRRHAQVLLSGDRPILRDLGSQNGTYVNDKPVRTSQVLINGDRIRLGDVVARVWVG